MKKKLFSMILTLSLVMGMTSAGVFADTQTNQIQNLQQLKDALSENLTIAEQTQIIENADDAVLDQFLMEKMDAATELLTGQEIDADMLTLPDGRSYGMQKYDLGDGCTLTVELSDVAEGTSEIGVGALPMASTTQPDQWKEYGNRYFTAKASVTVGSVTASMSLKHRYTLSADGIEAKGGDAEATWPKSGGRYSNTTPSITDRYAKTVGASDVNIDCVYSFISSSGAKNTTVKYKLATAVGYVDINKTAKKIKVRHSWDLTKVS